MQYFLSYVSLFNPAVRDTRIDGIFGPSTAEAVQSFQTEYELPETGIADADTWYTLYDVYRGLIAAIPPRYTEGIVVPYPGFALRVGTESEYVTLLQEYLNYIAETYTQLPTVPVTGYFGAMTYNAVSAFQRLFGLEEDGVADVETWNKIIDIYEDLYSGSTTTPGQYPGYTVAEGEI